MNPDECRAFVWVPFLPTSVPPIFSSLQPSPDKRDKRSSGFLRCLSPQETPDELQELVWVLAPPLHHLDTYQCPCPSREPRRMLSIRLGSFSAYLSLPHLFVTPTIPRRAR